MVNNPTLQAGSGHADVCPCRWSYRGILSILLSVDFPDMDVKHLSQHRFFRQRVAYDVKPHIAAQGAPSTQEIVFGLGF
jgi:hypothetical protein